MELSVIIPVYNAEKTIRDCINSVLEAEIDDYEIIIVDDGSNDTSTNIIKEYSEVYKNIHLIEQDNSGPGKARNVGVQNAIGKYIHFLDSDDKVLPNAYSKLINLADELGVDYVKARNCCVDINTKENVEKEYYSLNYSTNREFNKRYEWQELREDYLRSSCAPWTGIIRREFLIDKHIGFKEGLISCDDRSFYVEMFLQTDGIAVSDQNLVLHTINNSESLVGRRGDYFADHFISYNTVRDFLHRLNYSADVCKLVLTSEFMDMATWYNRMTNSQKLRALYKLQEFLNNFDYGDIASEYFSIEPITSFMENARKHFIDNTVCVKIINSYEELVELKDGFVLYGAGKVAKEIVQLTSFCGAGKIKGILVSDKTSNEDEIYGIKVQEITDHNNSDISIVIAVLNWEAKKQILELLITKGYRNIYLINNIVENEIQKVLGENR